MKKVFIVLFILISSLSFGQEKKNVFGFKAGGNISKYIGNSLTDYKGSFGFYLGGFSKFNITKRFKIQAEILYGLQGSKELTGEVEFRGTIEQEPIIINVERKTTESTFITPIVGQFYLTENLYLEAGPQVGLIINSKSIITNVPSELLDISEIKVNYDSFDFGVTIGMGFNLINNIGINTRYYFGLIERYNINNIRSSVWNLGIEYKF